MNASRVLRLGTRASYPSALGWVLFALWALTTAIVGLSRPGEVLELALGGLAGITAWLLSRPLLSNLAGSSLVVACFAAPLLNTLPLRIYDSAWSGTPRPLWALASVESLLVLAAAGFNARRLQRVRVPAVLAAAAAAFLVAGAISSVGAVDVSSASAYAWVTFAVPIVLGLLVSAATTDSETGWRWLEVALAAALVPAYIAISAYAVDFGLPTSSAALVLTKVAMFRPHLFQDATFGNVLHLADFALVLLPSALVAACAPIPRAARATGAALSLACVGLLILVLSRSALIVAAAVCVALAAAFFARAPRRHALVPVLALCVLVAVMLTPTVRHSFSGLLPTISHTTGTAKPGQAGGAVEVGGSSVVVQESSEAFRLKAIRGAWSVFRQNAPFGVGTGEYPRYDPIRTAAHSLPLQLLAENGVLGALGFALLYAYLLWTGARTVLQRHSIPASEYALRIACAGGALTLLTHGVIAGVALSLGSAAVWALLLWLQVGVLAGLDRSRGRARA